MVISKVKAQKKLSVVWFINGAILVLLFIIFTVLGRFDNKGKDGWSWLFTNILPVLTLMIGTFYNNLNQPTEEKFIDIFYYRLCFGISIFYILLLYLTILLSPLAFRFANLSIIDLFNESKIYLAILQGLLTYTLGLFFVKESKQ